MTARARALALATAASLVGLLTCAGATLAADPVSSLAPGTVQTVTLGGPSDTVLPLQVDRLYPGAATHARFVLRRGSGFNGGIFAVEVSDVKDLERGCNRPEVNTGDASCGGGDDQGELSAQLLVGQSWTSAVGDCATAAVPTTGIPMRGAAVALAPAALSMADEVCLVVGLVLPTSADNLVQTDLVRFDLRLGLQDANPVPGIVPGDPSVSPTPQVETTASPSATSDPSVTPSPSPLQGGTEQPAEGVSPTASPLTSSAGPSGSPTAGVLPALDTLGPQPRMLPFTGDSALLLAGWAALALMLGLALLHAVRRPAP